jgi:hypothetical protein
MYKSATKCNETIDKWCKNKHGASKIIDTFETYHAPIHLTSVLCVLGTQETFYIRIAGLLERDSFDLLLPEFDKPWVIHLRETCSCSTNLCTWRPNTVYKNRRVRRHHQRGRIFIGNNYDVIGPLSVSFMYSATSEYRDKDYHLDNYVLYNFQKENEHKVFLGNKK